MGGAAARVRGPLGPAARHAPVPLSGDPHARPRRGPCDAVRARARLALLGRPLSGPAAPLPPRRRGRVRHDGLVTAGPGAPAARAVFSAPRAGGAGGGAGAGRADSESTSPNSTHLPPSHAAFSLLQKTR